MEISVSTVVNVVVGSLLFVSPYQIGYLNFFVINTDNLCFSDTHILKNCNSHILHGSVGEDLKVYSVERT